MTAKQFRAVRQRLAVDLRKVHSALDAALGDSDVTHVEDDDELRDQYPAQWAAEKLAAIIQDLEK